MKINQSIKLILKTYLLVLSIFTIFRILLFFTEINRLDLNNTSYYTIFQSFVMGVRFDIVISGYILLLPAIALFTLECLNKDLTVIKKLVFYWIFTLFTCCFIISSADIPYFSQFFDRFSIGAFEWIENIGFVFSMIIQEPKYSLIAIPFFILNISFFLLLKRVFNFKNSITQDKTWLKVTLSLFILLLMFIGIRGRVQKKSPIRIGTAYFSDNPFLNKLGLNPVFTLMRSYLDSKDSKNAVINIMNNELAIKYVQKDLGIQRELYDSPIARDISFDPNSIIKPNIVLVIMESMSAAKMKRYGNKNNLTPFLDSLANNSTYFENLYTAGKHTFNGIFSTLHSFPALYRQHPMKKIIKHDGLSTTLLQNGYSTTYFTTHDSQFDNVEGFLRANDFQNIVSQIDYPLSEVKTTLGVPDDYMFRYSIPILNKLAKDKNPFLATFMTASDHGPFYIPDYFKPKTNDIKQQITEYADWSLSQFISLSSKEKWFENTIFIFVADHGAALNAQHEIALNYFHSPLVFFAPKILKQDTVYKSIGSQIDIYPTLMGMLKIPYINNTLGVDLINSRRTYAIINDDDKIGIIDTNYFCILKNNETQLFRYEKEDNAYNKFSNSELEKQMSCYGKSSLQVYQNMILRKETSLSTKVLNP